jgi:hypothetical protein
MRKIPPAAWLLLGLCVLFTCSCRRTKFAFLDSRGRDLPVRRHAGEYAFRLPRRAVFSDPKSAFYLRYRELPRAVLLRLRGEDQEVIAEVELPPSDGEPVRRVVALPRQAAPRVFSLHPLPGEKTADYPEIMESGFAVETRGFSADEEERVLGTLIDDFRTSSIETRLGFSLPKAGNGFGAGWGLEVGLQADLPADPDPTPDPPAAGRAGGVHIDLLFAAPGRLFPLRLALRAGDQSQSFYDGVLPFRPATLTLLHPDIALRLTGAEIFPLPGAESPAGEEPSLQALQPPLSADPEIVLRYDPERWRGQDFELFRWNKFPQVLIFDTADYEVQDRYFKRLAFFVEKKDFRGRLVSPQEVGHLHGYNAHDYRAQDLARFFSAAAREKALLSAEESLLLKILLAEGIVRAGADGETMYLPGRGAVLSISRSSTPALRRHLLIHECLHGVFFSSPAYRTACRQAWERLSGAERGFWELFLAWQGYDIADRFLVINEFQAYMLQQPRPGLSYYFEVLTRDRLLKRYPEREAEIRLLVSRTGAGLEDVFERLERTLWQEAALLGGQVSALRFPPGEPFD